jgi:RNA polymerase sigma factor (sigma-70 family)
MDHPYHDPLLLRQAQEATQARNNEQLLPAAGGEEDTLLFEVQDAMEALDDRSRELLTLKYFHDLKIKEVAALYNRPEGTVKTWLNKVLKSLREKLEESGGKMDV